MPPRPLAVLVPLALLAAASSHALAGRPNHDDCDRARTVGPLPYTDSEKDMGQATVEAADPAPGCTGGAREHTVWYTFTAATDQTIRVTTDGSDFDSFAWVGTGTCGQFTEIACDDDGGTGGNASLTFQASAGETYAILAGAVAPIGSGRLEILIEEDAGGGGGGGGGGAPPANNTCAGAEPITTVPQTISTQIASATSEATDPVPTCYLPAVEHTVWYRYTPATTGQVRMDTSLSTVNTTISVYTGSCDALVPIDCDYQYGNNSSQTHGRVDFLAEAGTAYTVMVSGPFPPRVSDEVVLDVSPGQSFPITVEVRDAATTAPIEGSHVFLRDLTGGNYTIREGFTGPDGTVRLYPPFTGDFDSHVVAAFHVVDTAPVSNPTGAASVAHALEPMGEIPPPTGDEGRIAYSADGGLWTMRPDGTDRRLILRGSCFYDPVWSADAERIAFAALTSLTCSGGSWDIFIARADGTGATPLGIGGGARPEHLAWSPDGGTILFSKYRASEQASSIWKVDAVNGGPPERLYFLGWEAAYSPDGTMIAMGSPGGTRVARADGSHAMLVSPYGGTPEWSPDGSRLAIGDGRIVTFAMDGTDRRIVLDHPFDYFDAPTWSPQSDRLVVKGEHFGWAPYRVDASGAGRQRIGAGLNGNSTADWSPRSPGSVAGDAFPEVRLLAPDGGEHLVPGTTYTILWDADDDAPLGSIDLYLLRDTDDSSEPIVLGLPGKRRHYDWVVPARHEYNNARVQVRVHDAVGQQAWDTSKYTFSIARFDESYEFIEVTAPAGGESFHAGDLVLITWERDSFFTIGEFTIELSIDGGFTWSTIDSAVPSTARSYTWTVPGDVSSHAVIRVRGGGYDESGFFAMNVDDVRALDLSGTPGTTLTWSPAAPQEAGELYDVIRGDIRALTPQLAFPGRIELGTVTCVENDAPTTSSYDDATPPSGTAWLYLVRPSRPDESLYGYDTRFRRRVPLAGDCPLSAP